MEAGLELECLGLIRDAAATGGGFTHSATKPAPLQMVHEGVGRGQQAPAGCPVSLSIQSTHVGSLLMHLG